MSLRRRLSVLVAIALAPSLLLTGYNAARWKIFLEDEAHTSALLVARFTSSEFEQIIENSRQLMTAMTKYPVDFEHDEQCTAYFKSIIADLCEEGGLGQFAVRPAREHRLDLARGNISNPSAKSGRNAYRPAMVCNCQR